jgi:diguanylate cyclase (GGDEF)-like protein
MDPRVPYVIPFIFPAVIIFLVAIYARHRYGEARGSRLLFLLCLSASLWSLTEGLLYLGFDVHTNLIITQIQYVGIATQLPLTLLFVFTIFDMESLINRKTVIALFSISILIIVIVWTNSWHKLYYTDYFTIRDGPFPMLGLKHGPLFWLHIFYHYLVLIILTIFLLRQMTFAIRLHRGQAGMILIAVGVVWIANIVYVTGNSPVPNIDISPIAYSLVAAVLAWGFFRYSLLDIIPVAKAKIFNSLEDPIIVLDIKNRVTDLNPAAGLLVNTHITETVGEDVMVVFKRYPSLMTCFQKFKPGEVRLRFQNREHIYDVRFSELRDTQQQLIGRLAVLREITKRKEMEKVLRVMATTDPLTATANRGHLLELAVAEFVRSKRYGRNLSVLMIDIDRFKDINDKFGHDVGDDVLKHMVKLCVKELRRGEVFGRFGGEEFVAVLPETSSEEAMGVAERIRMKIEKLEIASSQGLVKFTISIGVSIMEPMDATFQDLLKKTDIALYRAKADGRNCVREYQSDLA